MATGIRTDPEGVVWSLDMKEGTRAEYNSMDRSIQHEGKFFDNDLRAAG